MAKPDKVHVHVPPKSTQKADEEKKQQKAQEINEAYIQFKQPHSGTPNRLDALEAAVDFLFIWLGASTPTPTPEPPPEE